MEAKARQTCPGFFLESLLESPGNLLEICLLKFVDTPMTVRVLLQTPMSPVYPQMLEQIQQLSMNSCPGPTTTNGTSPVLGPHNGFFGVDDFAPR